MAEFARSGGHESSASGTGENESLLAAIPEILEIRDEGLQRVVREVWLEMLRRSLFSSLSEAVFFPGVTCSGLVAHVRAATRCAVRIAEEVDAIHGFAVNRDYLIAGALLHDVDKLIMYERRDTDWAHAAVAELLPHGYVGAAMAHDRGAPDEVVHIILAHPLRSPIAPATREAIIVKYADQATADMLLKEEGLPLLIEHSHRD